MNDIIVPAAQSDGISESTDLRVDIAAIYGQLDEGRQQDLAEFGERLLEEQAGGREAPRPVTLTDLRHIAERLGVSIADVARGLDSNA